MPKILMPYTVHLDNTLRVTPVSTLFYKGDSKAHRFELNVLSKGLQADLSGCTAVYRFYRLQDSTLVSNPASIENGKVVAVLDKACYDYIGRFALTIAIQNGEEETTVFYGDGYMSGNRADTGITGDYVVYDVETLLAKIAEIETAIANANTAIANANTAAENANAAEENANAAASGAQSAAGSANEAAGAANTAAGKANTAASTANTAAGTANSAASSAQTATQNANAATQASQTQQQAVAKAEAARDTAEQARQDAEQERAETFAGYEERIVAATPDDTTVNGRAWTSKKTVDSLCMPLEASGNPVQVYPVEGYPLGVKLSWEPTQAGSGDPSQENIRPITGRDAVSVTRCGENLLPFGERLEDIYQTEIMAPDAFLRLSKAYAGQKVTLTFTVETQDLVFKDDAEEEWRNRIGFECKGTLDDGTENYTLQCWIKNSNGELTENGKKTVKVTTTMPKLAYGEIIFYAQNIKSGSFVAYDFGIYAGTTAPTPYEPYTGSTTDIALPETVYGGTLDLETGVVTVDIVGKSLTGNEEYKLSGINPYFSVSHYLVGNYGALKEAGGKCSHFPVGYISVSDTNQCIAGYNESLYIRYDALFDSVDSLKSYLSAQYAAGTPVQVCYKLATPTTIQLTKQQIAALSGVNTLYTDAGTLTVTGREDPHHTIVTLADRIAALESAAAGV